MRKDIHFICKGCPSNMANLCDKGVCLPYVDDARRAEILSQEMPLDYNGIRFTSDAMDCAFPIAIDSHSGCSYGCLYCFANNLMRAPDRNPDKVKKLFEKGTLYSEFDIKILEKFLNREYNNDIAKAMYPLLDAGMPVQLGALGDPLDEIEKARGWLLKAIPMFQEHKIPVRVGTKGALTMMLPEYRDLFHKTPDQFWFAFSIISADDDLITEVDIAAPNATERFAAMKAYSAEGHPVSLRFRPFLPGLSDRNDGIVRMMDKAAECGAQAVSFEFIFLESGLTSRQKVMYHHMFKTQGNKNFGKEWNAASKKIESCRRGSREQKFEVMSKVRELAHERGIRFACSDPHFKEWNDTGCCCGVKPDDPIFGKWSRRQLTNVVHEMKTDFDNGIRRQVSYEDWAPQWAHDVTSVKMFNNGDWHHKRVKKNQTFGDTMRNKWNDPKRPRSPHIYFAGIMRPVGVDDKTDDVVYEYRDWNPGFDKRFQGECPE
jgi:DNA repair photolyase